MLSDAQLKDWRELAEQGIDISREAVPSLIAALSRARAAAQVYAERVEALGLAADDNDPLVMATAEPIGAAQADLFAALGLLVRAPDGRVGVVPPVKSVEQLRAERDAARILAEVRKRERDEMRAALLDYAHHAADSGWHNLADEIRRRAGHGAGQ